MKKISVFLCILIVSLLSINSVLADTKTIMIDIKVDNNFTKEYALDYKNNQFTINGTTIRPIIKTNREKDLSTVNHVSVIGDMEYYYKFYVDIKDISLSSVNYVGFNLTGFKKYDENTFTNGIIMVDFSDLKGKGKLELNDEQAILSNPTTLILDPTVQLLPNATNKAYKNTTISSSSCVFRDATEFTNTEYSQVNVSDNVWYNQNMIFSLKNSYTYYKFKFNLTPTNIGISSITQLNFTHEGFSSSSAGCDVDGTCTVGLYYYNVTSKLWEYWTNLNTFSDTTLTKSFSNPSQLINSTDNITQFGICLYGSRLVIDIVGSYTDFAYANISYTTTSSTSTTTSTSSSTTSSTTSTTSTTTSTTTSSTTTTIATTTTTIIPETPPVVNLWEIMIYTDRILFMKQFYI